MRHARALALLALAVGVTAPASARCVGIPACVLVWSDEFDGTAVDTTRWSFQLGDGTEFGLPPGWGNNERQYYRAENASVGDGFLTITAREEPFGGAAYTSARLRSLGKGDFTFGRMEMRARMPVGQGLWPAFWMLPSGSPYGVWAASGELDIVEYVGSEPGRVFGTIHYGGPWPGNIFSGSSYNLSGETFHDDFHVFAVEWERGEIRWYVDDVLYSTRTWWYSTGGPFPAPFDVDFHLLLNLAVGGNLPGAPDATTEFPQELVVDYVRVYQPPPAVAIVTPTAADAIAPGDDLTITADAADGSWIDRMEFLQGGAVLGEDDAPPFELTVRDVAAGCYTLRARAWDVDGAFDVSAPVSIVVGDGCPQAPYRMAPAAVPGTIEVEDFDLGGPDVAYADADERNNGGAYRPGEQVDLEATADAGGGFNLGWSEPGEWLEYSVAAVAGTYDVEARVASLDTGGTFHLEVDGADATGPVTFPATGGWQNWTSVAALDVTLGAGPHVLRLVLDDGGFNVNSFAIVEPPDADGDRVPDRGDNCPLDFNPDQADHDGDDHGDACDADDDDDGLADDDDACPLSDLAPTVAIDDCDSGAPNASGGDGCTLADAVARAEAEAATHGGFVSRVARLANDARRAGAIDARQRSALVRCAAAARD